MSETLDKPHDTVPATAWTDPFRREIFEVTYGTKFGTHGYEFDASAGEGRLRAVRMLAQGVVRTMAYEYTGHNPAKFVAVCHAFLDEADHNYGGGVLLFGAATHELAQIHQGDFTDRMNEALEGVDSGFRLAWRG